MQRSLFLLILMGQCSFFTCHLYEYRFIDEKKTWLEAQSYCKQRYTDLATVSNMTDMMRLHKLAGNQKKAWIGLYSLANTEDNRMWHWSLPGVEFNESETNWSEGEPNDAISLENCGFINKNRLWGDISCEQAGSLLCYNEKSNEKFHLTEKKMKWLDAQSYCREHHTDLVSGLNQLEDNELINKIKSEESLVMIGLFRDTWRWSDGSSFSFRHWNQGFNSQSGEGECAMLDEKGRWKNNNCYDAKPFFCYDDKVILINESKTWEEALYYCRENHRDLVSITNLHQQRWIQEKAKKADSPYIWLGLRYTCTLDFWFWVSDEVVSYKNWASDGLINECDMSGAMKREGQHNWFSVRDNEKYNFICARW
eukprot:superscaffoldBa00003288_g16569